MPSDANLSLQEVCALLDSLIDIRREISNCAGRREQEREQAK
jgi:hypothetical protein